MEEAWWKLCWLIVLEMFTCLNTWLLGEAIVFLNNLCTTNFIS